MDRGPVCVGDLRRLAADRLEPAIWDFLEGGAEDERTLADNGAAFGRAVLRPRVLAAATAPTLDVTVFGSRLSLPVFAAPVGLQRLAHPEGELATCRAVARAGSLMVVSHISTVPVEELAQAGCPLWFQLYPLKDPGETRALVARAVAAGCRALVVTVDAPRIGRRERDLRNAFALPAGLLPAHLPTTAGPILHQGAPGASAIAAHARLSFDDAFDWRKLERLACDASLPLVVKGVLTAEDARLAAAHGAQGIIVSNHGGRQLDGVLSSLEALEEVVDAAGTCTVMLDGGVRRGTDVLKARALGARAVFIGRPLVWGLAVGGAEGVSRVFDMFKAELEHAMVLAGCGRFEGVGRDAISWRR
jgi:4-hydroxymandelate oxidase